MRSLSAAVVATALGETAGMRFLEVESRLRPHAYDLLPRGLAVLVACALLVTTVIGLAVLLGVEVRGSGTWRPPLQVVALSAAWLLVNGPYEGRVLWSPLPGHGLTTSDLAVVPCLLVAAVLAVQHLRA